MSKKVTQSRDGFHPQQKGTCELNEIACKGGGTSDEDPDSNF